MPATAFCLPASARGTGDGHGQGWNSNYVIGSPEAQADRRKSEDGAGRLNADGVSDDAVLYQANGAASERSGPPSLASSDDNGSNQVVVAFDKYNQVETGDTARTIGAGSKKHNNAHLPHVITHALTAEGADGSEDGTGRGTPLVVERRPEQTAFNIVGLAQQGKNHAYETAVSGCLQQTGMVVRRLTPTECERLQALPDGWTEYGVNEAGELVRQSDSARYRQIGNAGVVNILEWLGRRILAALNQQETAS